MVRKGAKTAICKWLEMMKIGLEKIKTFYQNHYAALATFLKLERVKNRRVDLASTQVVNNRRADFSKLTAYLR